MDDLPTSATPGNNPIRTNSANPSTGGSIIQGGGITIGKELESAAVGLEQPGLKDISGKEVELPKEVAAAGVTTRATTVQIPQNVTQMGVKPVGQAVMPQATSVALPLTDDQIVLGLKQSVTSSWRWLAEFCLRRLKQLHMTLKGMGAKTTRVKR
ncbi:hypothetical protein HY087_02665 [Candidatus Gottesmanbacteria bacterium]|nr:hypothetical protein [Candidatus Gottesmanbacteria bacterium]MBI3560003.1 hypothetical protein [Candidatus Gottesmanbacteria bacterium]